MSRIRLDAQLLKKEVKEFNTQLLESYQVLKRIAPVEIGQTPAQTLLQLDKMRLQYYAPEHLNPDTPALLICYALVNRPYMIDLTPERSLLKKLLDKGIAIYLVDWGYPDASDRFLDLDDYINHYLDRCVDKACEHAQVDQMNLMGICQGGTFSLCYTALHAQKISRLITLVTPVDFHTPDFTLSNLARHVDVDLAVATYGNIPGTLLNETYQSLMPMRLGMQKNLDLPFSLADQSNAVTFLSMEKWIQDSPDQAGKAFSEFIKDFFQQNRLVNDTLKIGDQPVRLASITQPILNIYATQDHLVPPSSSKALQGLTSTRFYREKSIESGHIGIFVSSKQGNQLSDAIGNWLHQDV
ncbi:class III poly(R)-hydroxyalkanoic acid synthase subunit PhaC [Nitrincola schmidtii]|uniref:class III poly(R)-hydroxyalkanoic acid synthase subunit PhaC n=1 Tax=Nitrincola schmidtii TaxID=1730894 RepID=UPI00124D7F95|nr:class III poly(R)-hydroxyalkanoic acid synthase subunit PhaC [Nitrincola schmidtii]